jgi:hypothetical protein
MKAVKIAVVLKKRKRWAVYGYGLFRKRKPHEPTKEPQQEICLLRTLLQSFGQFLKSKNEFESENKRKIEYHATHISLFFG